MKHLFSKASEQLGWLFGEFLQVPRKGASVWDPNFVIHREARVLAFRALFVGEEEEEETLSGFFN